MELSLLVFLDKSTVLFNSLAMREGEETQSVLSLLSKLLLGISDFRLLQSVVDADELQLLEHLVRGCVVLILHHLLLVFAQESPLLQDAVHLVVEQPVFSLVHLGSYLAHDLPSIIHRKLGLLEEPSPEASLNVGIQMRKPDTRGATLWLTTWLGAPTSIVTLQFRSY